MSFSQKRFEKILKNSELFFSTFIIPLKTNISERKFNKFRQTFINLLYDVYNLYKIISNYLISLIIYQKLKK